MKLQAVPRGKFRQVVDESSGETPTVKLYGLRIAKVPSLQKPYATFDLGLMEDRSESKSLRDIDAFIERAASPRFCPLTAQTIIVKLPPKGIWWENVNGDPALPWPMELHAVVDVVLKPGAFGEFGYCWLLHRIKPHSEAL